MRKIEDILSHVEQEIAAAQDLESLENIRVHYLGKKGELTELLKEVGQLSADERPKIGQLVNSAKQKIQEIIQIKRSSFNQEQLKQQLATDCLDVTLPGKGQSIGSLHPVTQVLNRMIDIFKSLGFDVAEGPEIEDTYYNFEALNIPEHHPARAEHDTFYCGDNLLLRTHTSPVQIHYMESRKPPYRMIAPGRVYRCDFDATHTPMFHQLEGLLIDTDVTFAHLKGILIEFLHCFFEKDLPVRFRPSYFPFTEPSAEVDMNCIHCGGKGCRICKGSGWLELLGCGMVHPKVLEAVNVDSEKYTGYAFGFGIDRFAMLFYQIDDLRLLFENDIRFLKEF